MVTISKFKKQIIPFDGSPLTITIIIDGKPLTITVKQWRDNKQPPTIDLLSLAKPTGQASSIATWVITTIDQSVPCLILQLLTNYQNDGLITNNCLTLKLINCCFSWNHALAKILLAELVEYDWIWLAQWMMIKDDVWRWLIMTIDVWWLMLFDDAHNEEEDHEWNCFGHQVELLSMAIFGNGWISQWLALILLASSGVHHNHQEPRAWLHHSFRATVQLPCIHHQTQSITIHWPCHDSTIIS